MTDDGVRVELDPRQLAATLKAVKAFSPALATATRRRLRGTGEDIVAAMKTAIMAPGAQGQHRRLRGKHTNRPAGMRKRIAAGTKLVIVAGTTRQGINIVTSSAKMRPGEAALVKAWNKKSFRHPVFGDKGVWKEQAGRPYFGKVIAEKKSSMADAIQLALEDAIREMQQ